MCALRVLGLQLDCCQGHRQSFINGAALDPRPAAVGEQPWVLARVVPLQIVEQRKPQLVVVSAAAEREQAVCAHPRSQRQHVRWVAANVRE